MLDAAPANRDDSRMDFPPTITEAAAAIRAGKLTSAALVAQCLERFGQYDRNIHAWIADPQAYTAALAADQELSAGHDRGILHGIPIGVKDILDVRDMSTRCGSRHTSAGSKLFDATAVNCLRQAGAIIFGKTVSCEWAGFDPSPTRNPWNLEKSPGGSSSGSAAAVAAGMCLGAIATQTGGSIIRPAAFCGVCGFKPTFGFIDMHGVQPLSRSLDHVGAIAHNASDAFILVNAMSGKEFFSFLPISASACAVPKLATVDSPTGFIERTTTSEVASVFRRATGVLLAAGASIPRAEIAISIEDAIEDHATIMAFEAAETHKKYFESRQEVFDDLGPKFASMLLRGNRTTEGDLLRAKAGRHNFAACVEQVVSDGKTLLMPAVSTTAPGHETTGDSRFQAIWSLVGLPAVTIPCGLSADGLPVGMQLIGRRNGECALYEAGAWCENVLGFHERPPLD